MTAVSAGAQTASQITPPTYRPPIQTSPSGIVIAPAPNLKTPPGAEKFKVEITNVVVEGDLPQKNRLIRDLQENLANRTVTGAEIFLSARKLEQDFAKAGYVLARVLIPEQRIDEGGTLRLQIVDGYIERIDLSRVPASVRTHLTKLLDPLVSKRGITYGSIERKLLLGSETPGTDLRTTLMAGSAPGASVLIVEATNHPVTVQFSGDNTLPDNLGRWTSGFGVDANSVAHQGEVAYVRANGYPISQGTLSASSNYSISTFNPGALSVTQRPIAVAASAQSKLYGDANPALTYVVGGSGLANGDMLSGGLATAAQTISNVGTYPITLGSLAASSNYSMAFTGDNLTVSTRPITVTAAAQSRLYGNSNPALTYAVGGNGLVNGDSLSGGLTTNASTTSNVGAYPISQGTLTASSNYALAYVGANLDVTPRALNVTADAKGRVYGDANPSLTYTLTGDGLVNGDTVTGALSTPAMLASNIGSYPIQQGNVATSSNYSILYNSANLDVTARPITVAATGQTRNYGDANPVLPYSVGGSGLVNGDSLTGALATGATPASNVGDYLITQGNLGGASPNYNITAYTGANLTVGPRPITVNADAQSRYYGNPNPALTYVVGGAGLTNGDTLNGALATTAATSSSVGSYPISQGSLTASANYALVSFSPNALNVAARPISIVADGQSRLYGDANPSLTYAVGGLGLTNGDALSGALSTPAVVRSGIGNYAISQGTLGASSNYQVTSFTPATLAVTTRSISVVADTQSRVYGNGNPALTYAVDGHGLVNGDTLSGALATSASAASNVGSYPISQGTLAASSNYDLSYTSASLSVTARAITLSADSKTRLYGDTNPLLTYTVGGSGLANGDTLSGGLSTSASTTSNTGAYPISKGTLQASSNYTVMAFTSGILDVTARSITIAADSQSRAYGDPNPTLTYSVGGSGLANGDTLVGTLGTIATQVSNTGSYAITRGSLAPSPNYNVSEFNPATLVVTQRPITITADGKSRLYGVPNQPLTYTVGGSGLANGDGLNGSLVTTATNTSGSGAYPITQGTLSASNNYNVLFVQALMAIFGTGPADSGSGSSAIATNGGSGGLNTGGSLPPLVTPPSSTSTLLASGGDGSGSGNGGNGGNGGDDQNGNQSGGNPNTKGSAASNVAQGGPSGPGGGAGGVSSGSPFGGTLGSGNTGNANNGNSNGAGNGLGAGNGGANGNGNANGLDAGSLGNGNGNGAGTGLGNNGNANGSANGNGNGDINANGNNGNANASGGNGNANGGGTGNANGSANGSGDGASNGNSGSSESGNGKPDFVQKADHFKELVCFHYRNVSTCSR